MTAGIAGYSSQRMWTINASGKHVSIYTLYCWRQCTRCLAATRGDADDKALISSLKLIKTIHETLRYSNGSYVSLFALSFLSSWRAWSYHLSRWNMYVTEVLVTAYAWILAWSGHGSAIDIHMRRACLTFVSHCVSKLPATATSLIRKIMWLSRFLTGHRRLRA